MRKKIVALILFVILIQLSLTACSNDRSKVQRLDKENTDEKVTLRITWWGSQTRHNDTRKLLDLYMKKNPHVIFEAAPSGWDGYFDKLLAQGAGNTMPDIIQMDYSYISTFTTTGLLADLQPYLDNGILNMRNLDQRLLTTGKLENQLTGIPIGLTSLAITYNPKVFDQAGLEMPTPDWTWEDFKSNMLDIQAKTGFYGTVKLVDPHVFSYWVRQYGDSLFSEDGTKLGYEDDQILVEYLVLLKELQEKEAIPNPDEWAQISSKGKEAEPVVVGESGTTFDWSNFIVIASEANPTLKLMTPPNRAGGVDGLWIKPSMFFSIAKSSEHKEEAVKFIDWFINSQEANDVINAERGIPVSSEVRDAMSLQLSAQQKEMFDFNEVALEYSTAIDPPEPFGVTEVNQLLTETINKVMYEQIDIHRAAADFRIEANRALSRNKNN
ncbi:ABC transporter substrate-binding protein [Bacillus sp. PS06]|uniref:ABC transporter substrate-binding protein n=1 Tax=Bacillus sp. PS06 TaxID=2764176 RepID=UPI001785F3F6|nr:extracellular solute-binding protein [Bacillus sp. PS06]MBD8068190.1 extracellular solute-binding protein [Bacillus sp. PS06]